MIKRFINLDFPVYDCLDSNIRTVIWIVLKVALVFGFFIGWPRSLHSIFG